MRLKMFTSVLNVTLHRVCRAARRSRDDIRIEVMSADGFAHQLSVLCDGVLRVYPVSNNTQWARALMNDALDGCFAADTALADEDANASADSSAAEPVSSMARLALTGQSVPTVQVAHAGTPELPAGSEVFVENFSRAVQTFSRGGNLLSVGQAGPLCTALRQARVSNWPAAQHQIERAVNAPGLEGTSALCNPAIELTFIERRFDAVRLTLAAQSAA